MNVGVKRANATHSLQTPMAFVRDKTRLFRGGVLDEAGWLRMRWNFGWVAVCGNLKKSGRRCPDVSSDAGGFKIGSLAQV